jgi:hypothetical protein
MKLRTTLSSVLLLCGPAVAQGRTWTVHQGGGGQFLEIQPAVDAASLGDRIEVLGTFTYQGFTLSKGLDVEATQGATASGCTIRLVPTGHWARVAGFKVPTSHTGAVCVLVERCAGPVLLAGLDVSAPVLARGIAIADCQSVLVLDCVVSGGSDGPFTYAGGRPALTVSNAHVTAQRVHLSGGAGVNAFPQVRLSATGGGSGLSIAGGSVLVAECTANGGPGGSGSGGWPGAPGGPGIAMVGGDLLVFAGSGAGGGPGTGAGPAVAGDRHFPAATRVTTDCSLAGGMQSAMSIPPIPYLVSSGTARLGGQADLTLRGPAGTVALLFFHAIHQHVTLPWAEGAVLLPLDTALALVQLAIGTSGSVPLTFPVPTEPALRDRFAFFQAIAMTPFASRPSLTNLGDFRLR